MKFFKVKNVVGEVKNRVVLKTRVGLTVAVRGKIKEKSNVDLVYICKTGSGPPVEKIGPYKALVEKRGGNLTFLIERVDSNGLGTRIITETLLE